MVSNDHIHINYRPSQSISYIVKKLKRRSSRKLQQEFTELRKRYWGQYFWAIGYGCWSTINITIKNGATAMLNFELQFGNLKAHGDGINFDRVVKDHTRSEYEGYLVKKDAKSRIKVKAKYGIIRFEVD